MVDMNSGDMECFFYKLWAKSGLDNNIKDLTYVKEVILYFCKSRITPQA
jgi:hypothetical protein